MLLVLGYTSSYQQNMAGALQQEGNMWTPEMTSVCCYSLCQRLQLSCPAVRLNQACRDRKSCRSYVSPTFRCCCSAATGVRCFWLKPSQPCRTKWCILFSMYTVPGLMLGCKKRWEPCLYLVYGSSQLVNMPSFLTEKPNFPLLVKLDCCCRLLVVCDCMLRTW